MRLGVFILLNLLAVVLRTCADEFLPVLRVGPEVYSNVTVTSVTLTDIYFTSSKGMANAKLKNLDPALQQHFRYDPAKVGAMEKKRQEASLQAAEVANPAASLSIGRDTARPIMEAAIERVKSIVNQPVRSMPHTTDMEDVGVSYSGWFHPGAIKPDFEIVDVRATQNKKYGEHAYFISDINPGVAFAGADIEFNSMTKYFYEDRTLPKKKLTEEEMLEINRLYRIIGKCEDELGLSDDGIVRPVLSMGWLSLHKKAVLIGTFSALVLLVLVRFLTSKQTA